MAGGTSEGPLGGLLARAKALGAKSAPVEQWDPPDCGPIPMRISPDGVWHYAGSPITRPALTRLFASILRREADGRFVLVTPVEKVTITVDDAPFLAVEMADEAGPPPALAIRTTLGDVVRAGPQNPLRFAADPATGGIIPYIVVRGGLEARFSRSLAIDLLDRMTEHDPPKVTSGGTTFTLAL
ncbi:MAG: DUF1285 domain-containing protein [Pseudomonadota bacterium]